MIAIYLLAMSAGGLGPQPSASEFTRAGITCSESVEPITVALIGEVRLTLTAEGDAQLAVDPVTYSSPPGWRVRSAEPATVVDRPGGKQQWRAVFRLTPDQPGQLSLPAPPIRVRSGGRETPVQIEWPPLIVRVTTTLPRMDLEEAHGVTGPEPVPPASAPLYRDGRFWAVCIAIIAVITAVLAGRGLRPPPPLEPSPRERAAAELDRLSGLDPSDPAAADALTQLLRGYLVGEYRLPAAGKTTAELVRLLPPESASAWQAVLERCDLARFANAGFSADEWMVTIELARVLVGLSLPVEKATTSAGPGSPGANA